MIYVFFLYTQLTRKPNDGNPIPIIFPYAMGLLGVVWESYGNGAPISSGVPINLHKLRFHEMEGTPK